jgi:hypothetical protein
MEKKASLFEESTRKMKDEIFQLNMRETNMIDEHNREKENQKRKTVIQDDEIKKLFKSTKAMKQNAS